jgi:hypothetical protein
MTIERRLQRLESIAAARSEDAESNLNWLSAAPEAAQRYIASLVDEYWKDVDEVGDRESARRLIERHPLYRPIQSMLVGEASKGELASLCRLQAHMLYIADKFLPFYPWPDPRWQGWRLIQRDYTEHLCGRAALATPEERARYEVSAWRECGTTDAGVLCAAGICAPEHALLAADEETRTGQQHLPECAVDPLTPPKSPRHPDVHRHRAGRTNEMATVRR